MMSFVGRVARILGPRGLMPNPKVGTVTADVMQAVRSAKMGSVEFKTDKMGVVAVPVGKASFTAEQLAGNVEAFIEKLVDLKPSGASKGVYIMSAHVASTQGPGVALDTKAQPFGKANAASSAGGSTDSAAAARASGRFGKMHAVNGFDVIRYDLGAFPSSEKVATSKGKWPQVIQAVRSARKEGDGWKKVLDKIDAINITPAVVATKPAAAAAKAPKAPKAEKPAAASTTPAEKQ